MLQDFPYQSKQFLPSKISQLLQCLWFVHNFGGGLEVVVYIYLSCGVCVLFYFSEFYFSLQQLKLKQQDVLSVVTLLEFLLGQQCKPLDPSKLEKKRKSWGEDVEIIYYFPLLLYFICSISLSLYSSTNTILFIFTYFKVKNYSNNS